MANIFLVEGETESKFLKYLNVLGSIKKFNVWEHNIKPVLRGAKPSDRFYVVYDTEKQKTCLSNLALLQQNNVLAGILQQTKDLEDELAFALRVSRRTLLMLFNARNSREFKSNFIKITNLECKLDGLDLERLWVQDTLSCLIRYSSKRVKCHHLKMK